MTNQQQPEAALIRVRILRGGKVVRSYKVHGDSLTIGSGAGCTIRVAGDTSLKAKHVSVYFDDGALALVPEPGAEVLLNGEAVDYALPQPTDVIKTGRLVFSVAIASPDDSVTSVPPPAPERPSAAPGQAKIEPHRPSSAAKPSRPPLARPVTSSPAQPAPAPLPPMSVLAAARPSTSPRPASSPVEDPAPLWPMRPSQPARASVHQMPVAQSKDGPQPVALPPLVPLPPKETSPPVAALSPKSELHKALEELDEPPTQEHPRVAQPGGPLPADEADDGDSDEVPGFETDDTLEEEAPTVVVAWNQLPPVQISSPASRGGDTRDFKSKEKEAPAVRVPEKAPSAAPPWTGEPILDEAAYFDEDDLEEQLFEEPFDLAAELMKKPALDAGSPQGPKEPYCAAHVVRVVRDRVSQTASVLPGQSFTSHTKELHCTLRGNKILVRTGDRVTGELRRGGTVASLSDVPLKRKWRKVMLVEGDHAVLEGAEGTYRIEVYRPPLVARRGRWKFDRELVPVLFIVAAAQILFVVAAALFGAIEKKAEQVAEQEVFAEVKIKQPEAAPPDQPDKPQPKKDTLAMSEKAPAVSSKTMRRIEKRLQSGTGGTKKPPTSVSNLVDRLMGGGGGKNPDGKSLKELVSNIDAVAPSSRGGSPFGIAGAIASLPGGGVNIARSGSGGDVATLSGDQVAGTGSGIATLDKEKRSGKPRGMVTKMTSGSSVQGSLSKEDVTRVVNGNIHMVQACYEKGLLSDPGLAGRIVFDWTVGKDGRVKGVRVRSSTLGNAKVADCISGSIKKWKFPKPMGGDAEITYPFMFRSVSS